MIPISPHDVDDAAAVSDRAPIAPPAVASLATSRLEVLSTNEAIVTIVKCAIGAASFSLPRAFQYGGVYFSLISTLALGILNAYTLLLLVDSSGMASTLASALPDEAAVAATATVTATSTAAIAPSRGRSVSSATDTDADGDTDAPPLATTPGYTALMAPIGGFTYSVAHYKRISYPEIGAIAFPAWTVSIGGQRHNAASLLISAGIVATSLGVCTAYLDFISDTLPVVLRGWYRRDDLFLTRANCPWVLMPIVLALSYLRTMKVPSFLSNPCLTPI